MIVDNLFWGMIYANDLFDPVSIGDRLPAHVKLVRDDGKIDVTLRESGGERVFQLARRIQGYLEDNGGVMQISDSSSPEEIKSVFQCSKRILRSRSAICIRTEKYCWVKMKCVCVPEKAKAAMAADENFEGDAIYMVQM